MLQTCTSTGKLPSLFSLIYPVCEMGLLGGPHVYRVKQVGIFFFNVSLEWIYDLEMG